MFFVKQQLVSSYVPVDADQICMKDSETQFLYV